MVAAVHSALFAIPKRCSLPSRFPPVVPSADAVATWAVFWAGEPFCSAAYATAMVATSITTIAA